ncbi:aspartoacylase-like [Stylophora pistillata]|uniref:aspartoacylase-like n=1 Tax=Stylophora pistillata TaxID=50429 RepID=UPI000C046C16|nr:aspartoacylase-like [Stylophora pistillata]
MAAPQVACHDQVKSLCISGGTHGNELSGVYLVKNWLRNGAIEIKRNSFRTHAVLANPRAVERCVRFIDVDLNRQIKPENLLSSVKKEEEGCPYEIQRARELYSQFQNEAGRKVIDFWLDLHNATANTGSFFIMSSSMDPFPLHVAAQMQIEFPELRIMLLKEGNFEGHHFGGGQHENSKCASEFPTQGVRDLGVEGMGLEMGPLAHGTLNTAIYNLAKKIVCCVLDQVDKFNNGHEFEEKEIEVFRSLGNIYFPTDAEGELSAMVSPNVEGNDWKPLYPGDPLFLSFSGETIPFTGESVVWPVFINEAAYFPNNIAMTITTKEKITVPTLKLKAN